MNRSLYPNGVEVSSRTLTNTENTRSIAIRQSLTDSTTTGTISGLKITVNGTTNTNIDVSTGYGYAPNGEYVLLGVSQLSLALDSYTLGVKNYVLLVYDEVASLPEANETDGSTLNTRATQSARIAVLSATSYAGLPSTDPILANNALDRAMILGTVTANGPGIAITNNSIQSPTSFNPVLQSNQPTNITGVEIIAVDTSSSIGTGTLTFVGATKHINWQAPGDGSPGTDVIITTSTSYTLTSNGGNTLIINVTYSQLPSVDKSDTITLVNIYSQAIKRFTAEDFQHRSMIGTGVPSSHNPHGLTLNDIAPGTEGTLEEHQDIMHANGIAKISATNLLLTTVNTGPAPDTITSINFTAGDLVYINGKKISSLSGSNTVTFGDGVANPSTYLLYLNQDGSLVKQVRAAYPVIASSVLYDKTQIINVSDDIGTTSKNLVWTSGGNISFDGGPAKAAPSASAIIRLYAVNRISFIDIYAKGASTPGSTQTDSISFTAGPIADEVMPIAFVVWSGSATGFLGFGFSAANAPNIIFDKRQFGTLDETNTRTDAGLINTARAISEILGDGILVRSEGTTITTIDQTTVATAFADQFSLGSFSALNVTLTGGVVYINGHRLEVLTTAISLTDNATNRIYIDYTGTIKLSTSTWATIAIAEGHNHFVQMWEVVVAAAAESSRTDYRTYIGQKRDAPMGVVALDVNQKVLVTSVTGDAITGTSAAGNGIGITGNGHGSGYGVLGFGGATGVGVRGIGGGPNMDAIYGTSLGSGAAVRGDAFDASGRGVVGIASNNTGIGVYGQGNGVGLGGKFISNGSSTVNVVQVDGWIDLSGSGSTGTDPFINVLTKNSLVKAWVVLTCNNTVNPTINASFNITSVVQDKSGGLTDGEFTVTIAGDMSGNTTYSVLRQFENYPFILDINTKVAGSFHSQPMDSTGNSKTAVQVNNGVVVMVIIGLQ